MPTINLPEAGQKPWDVDLNTSIMTINDQVDTNTADIAALASSSAPDASTTVKGIVELATSGETTTGTDTVRAVTPAGLKAVTDVVGVAVAGSANNPHTTEAATRNSALPKNFWQYTGTAGVNDPDHWIAGDEWISA